MNPSSSFHRNDRGTHAHPSFQNSQPFRPSQSQHVVWLDQVEQDRLLRKRSLSAAKQGDFEFAIEGLTLLIDRNPEDATDYNNRGLVHYQSGCYDAALEDYNRAIRLNPRLASAYNNRANYFATQGSLAEAIADYETAIDLDPTNLRAWVNQAITFRDLEMYAPAIENLDHALQISELMAQTSDEARLLEANIYSSRGRTHHLAGDWNCAIADYYRALERLQGNAPAAKRLSAQITIWMNDLCA